MKRIYTLFALICLCALFLTMTNHYKEKNSNIENNPKKNVYLLISEDETVKLYQGDVLLKTYNNILPSSLPAIDRDNLKSGIVIENYEEVISLIEDFDG